MGRRCDRCVGLASVLPRLGEGGRRPRSYSRRCNAYEREKAGKKGKKSRPMHGNEAVVDDGWLKTDLDISSAAFTCASASFFLRTISYNIQDSKRKKKRA